MKTFAEFGLEPKVLQAITELGFEESTPIQAKAIPIALARTDLIGQAQTGTGKTAAFGIPLINKIPVTEERIVALIMTPTRELAIQVAEEIGKLTRFKGIRSLADLWRTRNWTSNPRIEEETANYHRYTWTFARSYQPQNNPTWMMFKRLYWMKRMKCWIWASWRISNPS